MFSSTWLQTLPQPATSLCESIMQKSVSDSLNLQARHCAICSTQQLSLATVATVVLVALTVVVLTLVAVLNGVLVVVCVAVPVTVIVVEGVCDIGTTSNDHNCVGWSLQPTIFEFHGFWQNCSMVIPASQASRSAGCPWRQSFGLSLTAVSNTCLWSRVTSPDPKLLATTRRLVAMHIPTITTPRRRRGIALYSCVTSGHSETELRGTKGESSCEGDRPPCSGEVRMTREALGGDSVGTRHPLADPQHRPPGVGKPDVCPSCEPISTRQPAAMA